MNKQQLASKIWESANKMRSKIEANEYKDYILGFIFYKFLSDREEKYVLNEGMKKEELKEKLKEENNEILEYVQKNIGYFISYDNLFSTWIEKGKEFDISNVRDALSAFSRLINSSHRKVFEGIFDTLQSGLSKLGENSKSQTKAARDLIYLIRKIPMSKKQDYDVLGFIYEYLIQNFAANAGKKAGEFYTPHEVSVLMSEIIANHLKTRKQIDIYDPTSGSGSLLINIGRSASKYINPDNIRYYAQELKQNTYNLTRMNLVMRGIKPDNIITRNADTLEDDWPYFDETDPQRTYKTLYLDGVVSNPPYSQNWDSADKETDPRYKNYGLAPKAKADYAFLLHDLFHVKGNGIMVIVMPHGVLFRGGEEKEIRKSLIENNNIDAIIGLPANIFFGTGIPTVLIVLNQKRKRTDIQIIDASKGFIKDGKNNKLRACDIKKIVDTIDERKNIDKYSRVITRDEIRKNDYNLNIPRYVDSSEEQEQYDIYASIYGGIPIDEINKFEKYWEVFPNLKAELFNKISEKYFELKVNDINEYINNFKDIKKYKQKYKESFITFDEFLEKELMKDIEKVNITREEDVLSKELFKRLKTSELVDKYVAYQLLDDKWNGISTDIEIIQTEGLESIKKVDPNMVIKKKKGKEEEVQDGWVGRILPFELVQNIMLKDEINEIENLKENLSKITTQYDELLDELTQDEKQEINNCLNEDNTSFVNSEIKKIAKDIRSGEIELSKNTTKIVVKVNKLINEEKQLRKTLKNKNIELIKKTKATIENLTDEQAYNLLKEKWITPIMEGIHKIIEDVINDFAKKLRVLFEKYETTFINVQQEIEKSEKEISKMIDELKGNEFDLKGLNGLKDIF